MRSLLIAIISITFLLLSSCSQESTDAKKIVGTWNHEVMVAEGMSMVMTFTFDQNDSMQVIMFGQSLGSLTYELRQGNIVTLTEDGTADSMPYSFVGDSLILIMDDSDEGRTAWSKGEIPTVTTEMPADLSVDTTDVSSAAPANAVHETSIAGTPIVENNFPAEGSETVTFLGIRGWGGDSESYEFQQNNGTTLSFQVQWNRKVNGANLFKGGKEIPSEDGHSWVTGQNIGKRVLISWNTQSETNMGGETHEILALTSMKLITE